MDSTCPTEIPPSIVVGRKNDDFTEFGSAVGCAACSDKGAIPTTHAHVITIRREGDAAETKGKEKRLSMCAKITNLSRPLSPSLEKT